MIGDDVAWLQRRLAEQADGVFGSRTRDAVVALQIKYRLLADGVVGPTTWRAIGVAAPSAAPVFTPPIVLDHQKDDLEAWARMLRAAAVADAEGWAAVFVAEAAAVTSPEDRAAFLANILHETGNLSHLVENLYYTTSGRLMAVWPRHFPTMTSELAYLRNPKALAEKVYAGRLGNGPEGSGDGYQWRGRGALQLTGKAGYREQATLQRITPLQLAEQLETRVGAVESAVTFWTRRRCAEAFARGGMPELRRVVNGGQIGLKDVEALFKKLLPVVQAK
jgi:putative chitinase